MLPSEEKNEYELTKLITYFAFIALLVSFRAHRELKNTVLYLLHT